MATRLLGSFLTFIIVAALASCNQPGTGVPDPKPTEYATVDQAVAALDNLMADAVSIASGYLSNADIASIQRMPCLMCDFPGLPVFAYPGFFWLYYDLYGGEEPEDGRLAAGTFAYDDNLQRFAFTDSPADALSIRWTDSEGGEEIEVRSEWKVVRKASTYSQPASEPFLYFPGAGYPYSVELDVPERFEFSVRHGPREVVHLEVEQGLANTTCGRLAETRSVTASGFFNSGAQRIEIESFAFDRTKDTRIAASLDAIVRNGSMSFPISIEFTVTAGQVTRDTVTCEVDGLQLPLAGTIKVSVGDNGSGVGLRGSWDVEFEDGDLSQPVRLNVEEAMLVVGEKRVDITGFAGLRFLDTRDLQTLVLTFADSVSLPLLDFGELLTYPALP